MEKLFKKTINPFCQNVGDGRQANVFVEIELKEGGRLSISGVVGPQRNGNALGGCGQINMEYQHRDPKDNDCRYSTLIAPAELKFKEGWSTDMWLDFLGIWRRWHLNDMRAECDHQRALGWTYEKHHDRETFRGDSCPTCGYKIGSQWLSETLPDEVIYFLEKLPTSTVVPAWV